MQNLNVSFHQFETRECYIIKTINNATKFSFHKFEMRECYIIKKINDTKFIDSVYYFPGYSVSVYMIAVEGNCDGDGIFFSVEFSLNVYIF